MSQITERRRTWTERTPTSMQKKKHVEIDNCKQTKRERSPGNDDVDEEEKVLQIHLEKFQSILLR